MKTKLNQLREKLLFSLCETARFTNENKKTLLAMYTFAFVFACTSMFARAGWEETFPLWATTKAVLNIIYPIFVVAGIILFVVGIILIFVSRFNEQSLTGPLIIVAVSVGLIVIRILIGTVIEDIAFNMMYPDDHAAGWSLGEGGIPTESGT